MIHTLEQQYYSPTHIDSIYWVITAYNCKKINPIGDYSGPDANVYIRPSNDSLQLTFNYDNHHGDKHKWENVQSSSLALCSIYMPKQAIVDQVTGQTDSIEVYGRVLGNNIHFEITISNGAYPIIHNIDVER